MVDIGAIVIIVVVALFLFGAIYIGMKYGSENDPPKNDSWLERRGSDASDMSEDLYDMAGGFFRKNKKVRKFGITGLLLITLLVTSFGASSYSSLLKSLNDL